jgi:hypothetical protein
VGKPEGNRLRVFEKRRTFIWTEEELSDRRLEKLHNEEFHNSYSSRSVIRRMMIWAGHLARMGRIGMV